MAQLLNGVRGPALTSRAGRKHHLFALAASLVALVVGAACSQSDPADPAGPERPEVPDPEPAVVGQTEFVSVLNPGEASTESEESADDGASASPEPQEASGPADANRAITEADIIHIAGDTLYALSEYSGLTLVDIGNPAALSTLGHAPARGTPFEMYVQDDVVISMLNAYGHYAADEATQQTVWVETSRVLALDTSDPSSIETVAELTVPGSISDSRLVGDILYLVTTEYGCWGCSEGPSTVVTSFDLSDLQNVHQVDQLRYEEPADTYIGQRSISVNQERIYIGGRDWDWTDESQGSIIQVVDISDPAGDLVEGTALPISGQIDSRWQMDEHEGVLRVLSQWEDWRSDSPPTLETYRVDSASEITKLAALVVQLPRPEVLQSVRFDGERAYAITFEQTDPLFTFDLSDPANPKQMGELEIPGWVYHMEPRGDRIYAIGFDNENEAGALHVSLFDVADMAAPTMLQRVNFGGDWASFAEDQDRIHKSFKLFDEEGFIVVPFSGWDWDEEGCNSSYASGIQLVDFTEDTLALRGVAPQVGQARRAFVHEDHLFGISDDAVQSFDISNRDEIQKVDTLETARNVETVRIVGDRVLRFGTDWWTDRSQIDVTDLANVTDSQTQNALDLESLLSANENECSSGAYWGNVYVVGEHAYVERYAYEYSENGSNETLTFLIIDLAGTLPELINQVTIELGSDPERGYRYFSGVVQTDSALLVGKTEYDYSSDVYTTRSSYQVIDTRDAANPRLTTEFEVPESLLRQGWGRFAMGCGVDMGWGWGGYYGYGYGDQHTALVSGDIVASSHAEALEGDNTRGRYYLDRIDLSDPESPKMLEKINIPGRAVHFEADTGHLLTIEDTPTRLDLSDEECWDQSNVKPNVRWIYTDDDQGHCERAHQTLHRLVVKGAVAELGVSMKLDGDAWFLDSTSITAERVFIKQFQTKLVTEEYDGQTYEYYARDAERVRVLDASLEYLGDLDNGATYSWRSLRARGARAFTSDQGVLRVFDATEKEELKVYDKSLLGYGCSTLEVRGNTAICAQGKKGVEAITLD